MSVKDIIFIVFAVVFIHFLYRRELLENFLRDISLLFSVLSVWLFLIVVTWKLMAFCGIPGPAAVVVEILGGAYLQFIVLATIFYYKH